MSFVEYLKSRARSLKADTYALYLAYRDPRTPWYAKLWAVLVVSYVFSPLDLIPDFIPVLGYLDDLVLVPLGVALALRMIPAEVMSEARGQARQVAQGGKPVSLAGAIAVVLVWLILAALGSTLILRFLGK
jgi:uncharacterized membrane protein YkvA (DUF1232 family)